MNSTPWIVYFAAYASAATALGTIGLAIATFMLARKTRELAQSGDRTADAAAKELELVRDQIAAATRQAEAATQQAEASAALAEAAREEARDRMIDRAGPPISRSPAWDMALALQGIAYTLAHAFPPLASDDEDSPEAPAG